MTNRGLEERLDDERLLLCEGSGMAGVWAQKKGIGRGG